MYRVTTGLKDLYNDLPVEMLTVILVFTRMARFIKLIFDNLHGTSAFLSRWAVSFSLCSLHSTFIYNLLYIRVWLATFPKMLISGLQRHHHKQTITEKSITSMFLHEHLVSTAELRTP